VSTCAAKWRRKRKLQLKGSGVGVWVSLLALGTRHTHTTFGVGIVLLWYYNKCCHTESQQECAPLLGPRVLRAATGREIGLYHQQPPLTGSHNIPPIIGCLQLEKQKDRAASFVPSSKGLSPALFTFNPSTLEPSLLNQVLIFTFCIVISHVIKPHAFLNFFLLLYHIFPNYFTLACLFIYSNQAFPLYCLAPCYRRLPPCLFARSLSSPLYASFYIITYMATPWLLHCPIVIWPSTTQQAPTHQPWLMLRLTLTSSDLT